MKRYFYYFLCMLLFSSGLFAQRSVQHTLTNFNVNTTTNKFSFDIYSQNIGGSNFFVGVSSFYFYYNFLALNNPVLSYVNPKYTGVATVDNYDPMTVELVGGTKIAVTIWYTGNGGTLGGLLSTAAPMGELMCTVTMDITDATQAATLSWDEVNSAMLPSVLPMDGTSVTNTYVGSNNSPLPVELVEFTGKAVGSEVQLRWKTATEVNNYGFEVERSVILSGEKNLKADDGGTSRSLSASWKTLGFVKGNGNSNSPKEYSFKDNPVDGVNFSYRLKQIDFNGKFKHHDAIEVSLDAPAYLILHQNFPNPFNPSTNIKFELPKDSKVSLKIYNVLGEEITTLFNKEMSAGFHEVTFNASRLASGIYFYRIDAGNFSQVKKMLLMK